MGGDIRITTNSLSVTNGARLTATTLGKGNAGNIIIDARDRVSFDGTGTSSDGTEIPSTATSRVEENGRGMGGDIRISANSLSVTNGASLSASILGQGNAGNIIIDAHDVSFDGTSSDGNFASAAVSRVEENGRGIGGNIRITTNSLSVTNGGRLNARTNGQGDAGNIIVNARDISFDGRSRDGIPSAALSGVEENGRGMGGDIRITTNSLSVTNGARLTATTLGKGNAGNIIIDARDRVSFDGTGTSSDGKKVSSTATSRVEENGRGMGGDIRITANSLSVTNGGSLNANTNGQGNAGNIIIDARDVSFDGTSSDGKLASIALSRVEKNGRGMGGDIRITANSLSVINGASLNANTNGQGNAGNIIIDVRDVSFDGRSRDGVASAAISSVAKNGRGKGGNIHITPNSLSVTNGAGLFASTDSQGDAGSVIINARDRVSFDGTSSSGFTSAVASTVESGAVGKGGSINITTAGSLSLTNGAELSSSSFGEGIAGDVQLTAGSIDLNQGAIRSITGSGDGGNITLSVQDILLLRHGSRISATAGTAQQDGDGGNITINAPNGFIVGGTRENNDITANAFSGSGGRVTINATGIFGMTVRTREDLVRLLGTNLDPQRLPTNDITAISQTSPSLSGTVTVNTPDVDPNSGLVNLPAVPVDTQVAQSCTAGSSIAKSQFTITGRGGLPPNPGEALNTDAVQVDLVTLNPEVAQPSTTAVSTNPTSPTPARIVEATGWVIDADGNVVLTANASTVTPHNSWQRTADCRAFNQQPGG
jgi:large exoprotein involved in heme utilization and adhesion